MTSLIQLNPSIPLLSLPSFQSEDPSEEKTGWVLFSVRYTLPFIEAF